MRVDTDRGGGFGTGGINIDDLFSDFFGSRAASGPMPGADQEAELELTVEDAYRGGTRRITLSGPGEPVSFEVQIPPGITEGQRIRICWPGCAGLPQWPSGGLAPGGADRTASPVPGQRAPQLVGLVTVPAADRLAT